MSARSAEMPGLLYALLQALSLLAAGKAVMEARTAQGATAWAVALVAFPLLALPLFLVFGQSRFRDYVTAPRGPRRVAACPRAGAGGADPEELH